MLNTERNAFLCAFVWCAHQSINSFNLQWQWRSVTATRFGVLFFFYFHSASPSQLTCWWWFLSLWTVDASSIGLKHRLVFIYFSCSAVYIDRHWQKCARSHESAQAHATEAQLHKRSKCKSSIRADAAAGWKRLSFVKRVLYNLLHTYNSTTTSDTHRRRRRQSPAMDL